MIAALFVERGGILAKHGTCPLCKSATHNYVCNVCVPPTGLDVELLARAMYEEPSPHCDPWESVGEEMRESYRDAIRWMLARYRALLASTPPHPGETKTKEDDHG